ncbi:MAG: hypothetical protein KQH63_04865 [Desulfobulbaceae bacterium]|nr:hypothetical protein [Desulfobulbaceae bacterium]
MARKISAWIILLSLLVVPFLNWRLGALLWMCACLMYVLQQVFHLRGSFEIERDHGEEDDGIIEEKQSDTDKS